MSSLPPRTDRRQHADIHGLLHALWTRAVGTKDYIKSDWTQLERWIGTMNRRRRARRAADQQEAH
jgi:hypothetical protein